jgi:hypothetical protein
VRSSEIVLAALFNLREVLFGLGIVFGIVFGIAGVFWFINHAEAEEALAKAEDPARDRAFFLRGAKEDMGKARLGARVMKMTVMPFILGVLCSIAPSPNDLWKLRVALLKLEMASPENVKAAGGHIEEVIKALECKHLGVNCPKEK